MDKERLNPLNDYLFMKYMGEKGDEIQLIAFLNAILCKTDKDKKIESVTILENRLMSADIIGDKSGILDLRAKMDDGSKVNIEVQLRDVSNMNKRSLFYWSREYIEGIKSGEDYEIIPNVIAINIVGTEYLTINRFHTCFHIYEDEDKEYMLTDALEIHFLDMVKFRRLKGKDVANNVLHRWLAFLDKNTSEETIKKIIEMDAAIKKAHEKIMVVTQDEAELHAYHMREMAIYDYNSGINAAEKRGIAIGEEKSRTLFIVSLKRNGLPVETIARYTMLTEKEVIKILEEQGLNC
jgi:predicted transposase/invertase (TIGR01784 family)